MSKTPVRILATVTIAIVVISTLFGCSQLSSSPSTAPPAKGTAESTGQVKPIGQATPAQQAKPAEAEPAAGAPASPAKKVVLRIGSAALGQARLNPWIARDQGDYQNLGMMYEPFAMPMMDGTVKPWIAKSWEYKPDQSAWIYHLDERAKWSDGQPLTSDDVKYTFETAFKYDLPLGATVKPFVKSIDSSSKRSR